MKNNIYLRVSSPSKTRNPINPAKNGIGETFTSRKTNKLIQKIYADYDNEEKALIELLKG